MRDLAFVRYAAPDLDEMESFLTDFGLRRAVRTERTLYMRASGTGTFVHAATPVGRAPLGPEALAQWGPPLSPEFLT